MDRSPIAAAKWQPARDFGDLHILELMAVGVHNNTFDERICYVYWCEFIKGAVADCRPLLEYLRKLPSGSFSYGDLVRLDKRWTTAKRFWQRWRH
jgi:hypothetical protein